MTSPIPHGRLPIPDGWEVTLEIRAVGPVKAGPKAALALSAQAQESRPAITVLRRVGDPTTAKVMLNAFLKRLEAEVAGLQIADRGPLSFGDGVVGEAATVSFEVLPGAMSHQRHAYRMDQGVVTHLIGSAGDRTSLSELEATLRAFTP